MSAIGELFSAIDSNGTTAVYRVYDASDRLLYVGETWEPRTRLQRHRKTKAWWPTSGRITVAYYASRHFALNAEAAAIRDESPAYNKRIPKRSGAVQKPLQVVEVGL